MRVRAEMSKGRGRESCERHRVLGRDDILAAVIGISVYIEIANLTSRHSERSPSQSAWNQDVPNEEVVDTVGHSRQLARAGSGLAQRRILGVILGHTCIQDARRVGLSTLVNPGSVGLSHEASGKACYAVFDGKRVALKRVTYELARTIAALRASPLRRSLVRHLELALRPDAAGDVDD
jgi:hypothetical protein